ncbi:hypothetical protein LPTSP4_16400 [Leptospira ryugenii]|uniref:Uncharacterized protein n=1 Tax=Leptospira ryugenii TaxID=1917863 RepID=A0A2P2DZX0_9LEPT|nr:hypothetical protein [Leptospira ryugenii]GBF50116.1 hypothetical protein LPTSP4_16400 [Leptospira ryugenii]
MQSNSLSRLPIWLWASMIVLALVCLLTLPSQAKALYFLTEGNLSSAQLLPAEEQERFALCQGFPCDYTHKVVWDQGVHFVEDAEFTYLQSLQIVTKKVEEVEILLYYTHFLYIGFILDILLFFFVVYLFFSQNRKKKSPSEANLTREKIDLEPLPSFVPVFFLGLSQLLLTIFVNYTILMLFRDFFHPFFLQFVLSICIAYFGYRISKKRLGMLICGVFTILIGATSQDIAIAKELWNAESQKSIVKELGEGTLYLQHTYVGIQRNFQTGSRSSKVSYSYEWIAPFIENQNGKERVYWVRIPKAFMENPKAKGTFFETWQKKKVLLLLKDTETRKAALQNAYSSLPAEFPKVSQVWETSQSTEDAKWHLLKQAFGFPLLLMLVWVLLSLMRMYLGR